MLLGLCGAADVKKPGGSLTWTRVNIVGFQSELANGLVVKYNLTPDEDNKTIYQDPIVQSIINLTKILVNDLLKLLVHM